MEEAIPAVIAFPGGAILMVAWYLIRHYQDSRSIAAQDSDPS
jgi:hypothetical protein